MKILLIRPKPHKETIGLQNVMICEPLELEYIGAYMKPLGHEVIIIDMILEKKPLGHYIKKHRPDLVGITGYISHVNIIKSYAEEIKNIIPGCVVVAGGVHAEVVPEDFQSPFIDFIVKANGLKTFREIVDGQIKKDQIKGVYQSHLECIKETAFPYPHPDRTLVARYRKKYYYMFHNPCALIKTSFGCPYQCSFCFCREITDGHYFTRALQDIIEEIREIPEDEIYIVDDDFLVDRDRLRQFFHLLRENRIEKKYLIYGRSDFIAENEDIIKEFAECGLRAVIVGLESSKEKELKKYNKNSSVESNERAIEILHQYGVECYGTLILGTDWTKADFDQLYQWLKKLEIKFINLQPFTPLPGTAVFPKYKDKLLIDRYEFEKWDLAHLVVKPDKITIRSYYFQILRLYYKITMNPANVLKMLKKYGLAENLKLSLGTTKITLQYIEKIVKG